MQPQPNKNFPMVVIWEITRACDLACDHCRIDEQRTRSSAELTTGEAKELIDSVASGGSHVMVLTGGDPLERSDLFDLIEYGDQQGLRMATIPATTTGLTRNVIKKLKDSGCRRMALSLDGPNGEIHDGVRGEPGTFDRLVDAAQWAHEVNLPLQINTVLSSETVEHFDPLRSLVQALDPVFWEVFFLVPTGEGRNLGLPDNDQTIDVFEKLYAVSQEVNFGVKVTEAPSYRRFCIEKTYEKYGLSMELLPKESRAPFTRREIVRIPANHRARTHGTIPPSDEVWDGVRTGAWSINSGKGFVFVSHEGEVHPSGFLPRSAGNVRDSSLTEIYRKSEQLKALRDPDQLTGRCGSCAFRRICGGSRSRAYALNDSSLDEDPLCPFDDKKVNQHYRSERRWETDGPTTG